MFVNASNPEVSRIVHAAFPDYTGRKGIRLEVFRPGMNVDSYWSGGHRNYWCIVEMSTLKTSARRETGPYQGDRDSCTFYDHPKYGKKPVNCDRIDPFRA